MTVIMFEEFVSIAHTRYGRTMEQYSEIRAVYDCSDRLSGSEVKERTSRSLTHFSAGIL